MLGKGEVLGRQPLHVMRRQRDVHLVVHVRPFGVVVHLQSRFRFNSKIKTE